MCSWKDGNRLGVYTAALSDIKLMNCCKFQCEMHIINVSVNIELQIVPGTRNTLQMSSWLSVWSVPVTETIATIKPSMSHNFVLTIMEYKLGKANPHCRLMIAKSIFTHWLTLMINENTLCHWTWQLIFDKASFLSFPHSIISFMVEVSKEFSFQSLLVFLLVFLFSFCFFFYNCRWHRIFFTALQPQL